MTLRREVGGNIKLPEGRTPDFLGPVRHSFILDRLGSSLFPQGRFCPDAASGVEQGLASLSRGSSFFYLDTNPWSLGMLFAGQVCIRPWVVVGSISKEELGGLLTCE